MVIQTRIMWFAVGKQFSKQALTNDETLAAIEGLDRKFAKRGKLPSYCYGL